MNSILARIEDSSQTAEARRIARGISSDLGFDETHAEQAAIVVTEMCTNLLKHGGGGVLILGTSPVLANQISNGYVAQASVTGHSDLDSPTLELLALDRGSGVTDLANCRRDGYSTSGSPGTGWGAIERLSSFWDVFSLPNRGTAFVARLTNNSATNGHAAIAPVPARCAGVRIPMRGEDVCGDDWIHLEDRGQRVVVVADGLGHGPEAARASETAVDIARGCSNRPAAEILERIHTGLRHTRGAAVAVALLNEEQRTVVFAGLGNIAARICQPGVSSKYLVSTNGTAGVEARHLREFSYPWPQDSTIVFHSDGLGTKWDSAEYPGLLSRDAGLIAGVLFRDYWRGTDDVTVVVAK